MRAARVSIYVLPRSLLRKSQPIAAALLSALNSLPGAGVGGRFSNEVHFSPALGATSCTPLIDVPVIAGRRFTLKGNATGNGGQRDKDKLKLACESCALYTRAPDQRLHGASGRRRSDGTSGRAAARRASCR